MPALYPRLSDFEAEDILKTYYGPQLGLLNFNANFNPQEDELDWLPLGDRKTIDDIRSFRAIVTDYARTFEFPKQLANRTRYTEFDRKLAELIYKEMQITPSIAADTGMWVYLNVKVIPDIIEWRWNINGKINRDRYYDRIRNYLGSIWWSFHIMNSTTDNTDLYKNIRADEFSGLMERTQTRGLPNYCFLVTQFCHENITPSIDGSFESLVRKTLKYLNAELGYINYFCLDSDDITNLCQRCLEKAKKTQS